MAAGAARARRRCAGNAGDGSGDDRIVGGDGRDRLGGGTGNDRIDAQDGEKDTVTCGPGKDRAFVDGRDKVGEGCDKVAVAIP